MRYHGLITCLLIGLTATCLHAQCETSKLTPSAPVDGGRYGNGPALDGDWLAIGSYAYKGGPPFSGAVEIFSRDGDGWVLSQVLTAGSGSDFDGYGGSPAMSDGVLVVAAADDESLGIETGAVYVYRETAGFWIEEAKLTPSDVNENQRFGTSFAIDGNRLVVGARRDSEFGQGAGAAYVFEYGPDGWVETAKLNAGEANAPGNAFGVQVDLDGDVIAVSAWMYAHEGVDDTGGVFVFRFDGVAWQPDGVLVPSEMHTNMFAGAAVAVNGDHILVGFASYVDFNHLSAMVYQHDGATWNEVDELAVSFVQTVHIWSGGSRWLSWIDDDLVVAGAPEGSFGANGQGGAATVYRLVDGEWIKEARIRGSDLTEGDHFGIHVGGDSDCIVIGANNIFNGGPGAAYVFSDWLGPDACDGDINMDGAIDATDLLTLLGSWGACPTPPDLCPGDLDNDGDTGVLDLLWLLSNWD